MKKRRTTDLRRRCLLGAGLASLLAGTAATTALTIGSANAWLGWTSLIPLLLAIRFLSPRGAGLAGAFWGACLFVVCGYGVDSAVPRGVLSSMMLCLIPALYAYAGSVVARRGGFNPSFLLVLGWVGVELALQPMVTGSGLLTGIGSSALLLLPAGSLAGYVLVALLVAMATVTVLSAWSGARVGGAGARRVVDLTSDKDQALPLRERIVNSLAFLEPARPRGPPVLAV